MNFEKLKWLNKYIYQINNLTEKVDLFLVGGLIRDIILGKTNPSDVGDKLDLDFATSWEPDPIWEKLNKNKTDDISIFRTAKYGTMTIIDKSNNDNKIEITPFRTESSYSDGRHPDEITWSDDIYLDSQRRDFTMNCIYYTMIGIGAERAEKAKWVEKAEKTERVNASLSEKQLEKLEKTGYIYMSDIKLLIIQSSQIISDIYKNGKFDVNKLYGYIWVAEWVEKAKMAEWVGLLIDLHKGIQDIYSHKIRAVGNPDSRFFEDSLRILRGIRFASCQEGFDIESKTWRSMKKLYFLVRRLSKERIHEEIVKTFKWPNPFWYIVMMDELNLMKYIFPSVWHLKWLNQPVKYHPMDVWHHTIMVLRAWQQLSDDYLVRLGCLYHDVGKTEQYYAQWFLGKDDLEFVYGSWLNHVNSGAEFAEDDFARIGFSNAEAETIWRYVKNHMKPWEILMSKESNQMPKLRKMVAEKWFEMCRNVVKICLADRRGQFNPIQTKELEQPRELMTKLDILEKNEWQFTMKNLAVNGQVLMEELGLKPGPELGELIKKAYWYVLDDLNRNDRSKLVKYCEKLIKG